MYAQGTLGYEVINHNNDYGFHADIAVRQYTEPLPSASILIPYYNNHNTINLVVEHILAATEVVIASYPDWRYEVLLLDDGSDRYPAETCLKANKREQIRIRTMPHRGRCFARNDALSLASNEVVAFVDADVLIHPSLLRDHLALHALTAAQNKGCISFALFDFHSTCSLPAIPSLFTTSRLPNDWRISCVYEAAWYGCEQDKQFTGKYFRPLADTHMLRHWPSEGFYGPWVLTNMVLGGFFTANRRKALSVGGCSHLFGSYAFEETSLITKMIAQDHDYVIPLTDHFALHLEDTTIGENREMKSALFRKAHQQYFQTFLSQKNTSVLWKL